MGWGNGISPPKDKGVNTVSCPPLHQPQDPSAGLQSVPSPGFLLFPCVGRDLEDNRTLSMTVPVLFFLNCEWGDRVQVLVTQGCVFHSAQGFPGFVRCLSMLLRINK